MDVVLLAIGGIIVGALMIVYGLIKRQKAGKIDEIIKQNLSPVILNPDDIRAFIRRLQGGEENVA
jgi:hypothetical protein